MQEMQVRSLGQENPLEKEMATTPIFQRNPIDRGAWWATVHRCKESDKTEQLNNNNNSTILIWGGISILINTYS